MPNAARIWRSNFAKSSSDRKDVDRSLFAALATPLARILRTAARSACVKFPLASGIYPTPRSAHKTLARVWSVPGGLPERKRSRKGVSLGLPSPKRCKGITG